MKLFNRLVVLGLFVFMGIIVACESPVPLLPQPKSTTLPSAVSTPTADSSPATNDDVRFVDESDCRAACHIPDPNETFAEGAKPQPASHKGNLVCLECHAKLDKPPLPSTHVGRMNPSCALCHKPTEGK